MKLAQDSSISAIVAGAVAVFISYAGPLLLVFQAASAGHLSQPQLSSWIWAISFGAGLSSVYLSWRYRAPVITAWSTPGAALLISSLPGMSYADAIGAYVFSAIVITALAWSGWFDRLMRMIPRSLAGAMLAGILFRFGTQVFISVEQQAALVLLMCAAYLCSRRWWPPYAIPFALLCGSGWALAHGMTALSQIQLKLVSPQWTVPHFSLAAVIGLGLPLCLVTLSGQNLPGMAVLHNAGYHTPAKPLMGVTGLLSLLLAPFGAHGINLAAITAAICTGREAHPDPAKRYVAGMACGVFYLLIGLFGATLASVFAALPKELIACIAGLALFGAIASGLTTAMAQEQEKESALICFLLTASNLTWLGMGAAFWGLVAGLLAQQILHGRMHVALPNWLRMRS